MPEEENPLLPSPRREAGLTFAASTRFLLLSARINILLIFAPLGILSGFLGWGDSPTFSFCFLSLVALAKVLGTCTEEIALQSSDTIGGLLNVTFGNMIEMILCVLALQKGLIRVVQASLLGSILSNLLLVLGAAFFAAGIYKPCPRFNKEGAQTSASLMAMAVFAFVIPAAFTTIVKDINALLSLSRCTALVLAGLYILFLVFQLKTHPQLFKLHQRTSTYVDSASSYGSGDLLDDDDEVIDDEKEVPSMSLWSACLWLLLTTLIVSVCAEFLVGSIEGISERWHISATFVGMILIPIVGNAAEHVTAISLAVKEKVDLAIGVSIGSSMQIALFVTPVCVIAGWCMGQPMSLDFSPFETSVLFVSVFVTNGMIMDGKTHWLEGVMLMSAYFLIGLAFFFIPTTRDMV